jgi:hypothetical protein
VLPDPAARAPLAAAAVAVAVLARGGALAVLPRAAAALDGSSAQSFVVSVFLYSTRPSNPQMRTDVHTPPIVAYNNPTCIKVLFYRFSAEKLV